MRTSTTSNLEMPRKGARCFIKTHTSPVWDCCKSRAIDCAFLCVCVSVVSVCQLASAPLYLYLSRACACLAHQDGRRLLRGPVGSRQKVRRGGAAQVLGAPMQEGGPGCIRGCWC